MLDEEKLVNTYELEVLRKGIPASGGGGVATICFSVDEAEHLMEEKEQFIFCQIELSSETIRVRVRRDIFKKLVASRFIKILN